MPQRSVSMTLPSWEQAAAHVLADDELAPTTLRHADDGGSSLFYESLGGTQGKHESSGGCLDVRYLSMRFFLFLFIYFSCSSASSCCVLSSSFSSPLTILTLVWSVLLVFPARVETVQRNVLRDGDSQSCMAATGAVAVHQRSTTLRLQHTGALAQRLTR